MNTTTFKPTTLNDFVRTKGLSFRRTQNIIDNSTNVKSWKVGRCTIYDYSELEKAIEDAYKIPDGYVPIEEIANYCQCHPNTATKLLQQNNVQPVRVGRRKYYNFDEFRFRIEDSRERDFSNNATNKGNLEDYITAMDAAFLYNRSLRVVFERACAYKVPYIIIGKRQKLFARKELKKALVFNQFRTILTDSKDEANIQWVSLEEICKQFSKYKPFTIASRLRKYRMDISRKYVGKTHRKGMYDLADVVRVFDKIEKWKSEHGMA